MRLDPGLCFLKRCGPPDNEAVQVKPFLFIFTWTRDCVVLIHFYAFLIDDNIEFMGQNKTFFICL